MTENKFENNSRIMNFNNPLLSHLLRNKQAYLISLFLVIQMIIIISNLLKKKPLIFGGESYYHLANSLVFSLNQYYYLPLRAIKNVLPESLLFILPLIISSIVILLFIKLAEKLNWSSEKTFLFLVILILTPAFIFNSSIISSYLFFILLLLTGFLLILHNNQVRNNLIWQTLSVITFIFATFIDFFSSLLLLIIQMAFFFKIEKDDLFKNKLQSIISKYWPVLGATVLFVIINSFFFKINFFIGPFHQTELFTDLVSDFGGLSGIGFFVLCLAIIGFYIFYKQNKVNKNINIIPIILIYFLFLIIIIGYFFNPELIFYLSILTAFFSVEGFKVLFNSSWKSETLKIFTLLIIILGIIFSTITYLERISDNSPQSGEKEALSWIGMNTAENSKIFALPEESDYVSYFSRRETLLKLHNSLLKNKEIKIKEAELKTILNSTYTDTTFPLLNKNNISMIYITPKFRQKYPAEQGLLFLLKNEKFKLVYSYDENEVWAYQK